VASAVTDTPLPPGLVAVGEVGLAAEVRPITATARRLAEAARLGFRTAIVPRGCASGAPAGMKVVEAADLQEALAAARRPRLAPID
jgi:DNA repair protein RadA/Sms